MRELKFLVGLGTILIFIGVYSIRAAFTKTFNKEGEVIPLKAQAKTIWLLVGSICLLAGVFLVVKVFRSL